jgi:transcription initiation factor TFIID subunit 5
MLVAAGTSKSYIQVWSLDGSPLIDRTPGITEKPSSSRRLIGHQDAVYSVAFSPSTAKPSDDSPDTHPRLLLSSSADKTIRMWSIDGWCCLCQFRAHITPVWDVKWGPYGHYFLSCGMDKVARIWSQEHISPLRMFVGHDGDVDVGAWHPNGCYVFTAGDKTVRMWDIMRGTAVRMFTGHTGNITALECAPDGKTLASADDQGSIFLWDLTTGSRTKRMRGHGKGGIWSLSWSVESTVIVSGGADNSVRVWDVAQRGDAKGHADTSKPDGLMSAPPVPGSALLQKKTKKDVVVTPDQLSVFPTKKSPVYKVMFTRSNLVVAGSAYMPEPV